MATVKFTVICSRKKDCKGYRFDCQHMRDHKYGENCDYGECHHIRGSDKTCCCINDKADDLCKTLQGNVVEDMDRYP